MPRPTAICFTPRQGKAVEINALWYHALRLIGEDARADKVAESFRKTFWLNPFRGLADVVDGSRRDMSMRPNQIFAVSLPNSPLTRPQQEAVVEAVRRELLTPVGLRTLARSDPNYHGRYSGPQKQRDAAYHNGTVWPWPLGAFLDAYLRVNDRSPHAIDQARRWLQPLLNTMQPLLHRADRRDLRRRRAASARGLLCPGLERRRGAAVGDGVGDVMRGTKWAALVFVAIISGVAQSYADDISLPLGGYFHPGRAMPVKWNVSEPPTSGGAIQLSASDAITTRLVLSGDPRGIVPWIAVDPNVRALHWRFPSGATGEISDLHPLDESDCLVGDFLADDSSLAAFFPNRRVIIIHLDAEDLQILRDGMGDPGCDVFDARGMANAAAGEATPIVCRRNHIGGQGFPQAGYAIAMAAVGSLVDRILGFEITSHD